jgi:uncharacterized protein (TIGR02246 family)
MAHSKSSTRTEREIRALYEQLLAAWNRRDAQAMANLFAAHGSMVGFDGTTVDGGPLQIEAHLAPIFRDHPTANYVSKVSWIRLLGDDVGLLQAFAGMVPRGNTEINPAANAIQTMVAVQRNAKWCVGHFQNTPAAFHGRPEALAELTRELQELVSQARSDKQPA